MSDPDKSETKAKPHKGSLKPKQIKALDMILASMSLVEIANELGVSRQTLSEWKNHNEAFRTKLAELTAEAEEEMRYILPASNTFMLSQLRKLAQEAPHATRLEAIRFYFENFGQKNEAYAAGSVAALSPEDAVFLQARQQCKNREQHG